jgi:butyryl-CoA dehydrogenase/short/branched chain acyl-CoA dehydrogenase
VLVDVQNTLVINALLRWGSDDVKRRYLPALALHTIGAYALSEAGSGSDAFALATRATERGDQWVLSGRKLWITSGNEADLFIVFANINPEAGYRGITAFLVERGVAGFSVGKGRQARHSREQHVRAVVRGVRGPARERPRRGRQGYRSRSKR